MALGRKTGGRKKGTPNTPKLPVSKPVPEGTVVVTTDEPLKKLGGSRSEVWNEEIALQVVNALWLKDPAARHKRTAHHPPKVGHARRISGDSQKGAAVEGSRLALDSARQARPLNLRSGKFQTYPTSRAAIAQALGSVLRMSRYGASGSRAPQHRYRFSFCGWTGCRHRIRRSPGPNGWPPYGVRACVPRPARAKREVRPAKR
jgi:hypothetical protein